MCPARGLGGRSENFDVANHVVGVQQIVDQHEGSQNVGNWRLLRSVHNVYYNVERMFKAVIGKGGQVKVCGTCAEGRGTHKLGLIEGAEISTMSQLAQWVAESDKVLTF